MNKNSKFQDIIKMINWQSWAAIISVFIALLTYIASNTQARQNFEFALKSKKEQDFQDSINFQNEKKMFFTRLSHDSLQSLSQQNYYKQQMQNLHSQLQLQENTLKENKRLRVKEVVKRLSEINPQLTSYIANPSSMNNFAIIAEAHNLVDECVQLSDVNPNFLNANEYQTITSTALMIQSTDKLLVMINRGLSVSKEYNVKVALMNTKMDLYYQVVKNFEEGGEIAAKIIEFTKNSNAESMNKKFQLAFQYHRWSVAEYYNSNNYLKSDSLLSVSEDILKGFPNYLMFFQPNIKSMKDSLKVKLNN